MGWTCFEHGKWWGSRWCGIGRLTCTEWEKCRDVRSGIGLIPVYSDRKVIKLYHGAILMPVAYDVRLNPSENYWQNDFRVDTHLLNSYLLRTSVGVVWNSVMRCCVVIQEVWVWNLLGWFLWRFKFPDNLRRWWKCDENTAQWDAISVVPYWCDKHEWRNGSEIEIKLYLVYDVFCEL